MRTLIARLRPKNTHDLIGAGANKARWGAFGGAFAGGVAAWVANKAGEPEVVEVTKNYLIPVLKGIGVFGGIVVGYVLQYLIIWGVPPNEKMRRED